MALFLFLLAKVATAYLPTALSVALRPLFPFQLAQYVQVFPLKPVPFCMLFAGLSSTNKPATLLLLSDSRSVLTTQSSPPPFLLSQTLWQIWQEPSSLSCSIRLQWVPRHSFLPENDKADELARMGPLLVPSPIPCSLSLLSRIHSFLFSHWRCTVSSKFFNRQVPTIATKLVLPRHACCVLSHLRCNGHSLLLCSYLSRNGRVENSSCSACRHSFQDTSHLILHCPAMDSLRRLLFGDAVSLSPLVQTLRSCPSSGDPWSSAMPPSLGRDRVTTTTNQKRKLAKKTKKSSFNMFESNTRQATACSIELDSRHYQ